MENCYRFQRLQRFLEMTNPHRRRIGAMVDTRTVGLQSYPQNDSILLKKLCITCWAF